MKKVISIKVGEGGEGEKKRTGKNCSLGVSKAIFGLLEQGEISGRGPEMGGRKESKSTIARFRRGVPWKLM